MAVADIDEDGAVAVAASIDGDGGVAVGLRVDVSDPASTEAMAHTTVERLGGIDLLINNAAIYGGMEIDMLVTVDWDYWPTDTQATRDVVPESIVKDLVKGLALKRQGTPDDMANMALFLLSDEASWITGQIFNVDGGQVVRS